MTYQTKGIQLDRPPVIETLFESKNVKIDRVIAQGQITPPGESPNEPSLSIIFAQGPTGVEYEGEHPGDAKKVTLRPGEYAIKSPQQKTRADYTSESEETIWLKVSCVGERGRYPLFTGGVGIDEAHSSKK